MVDYLKEVLEYFPEVITGRSMRMATNHLFQVMSEYKKTLLDEERATEFHHTVEKLLFVTSRFRKDIKTTIAFLCTGVRIPDEDDWGKLVRVLRYIRCCLHLTLIRRADSMSVIKWWVSASFVAHPDCKRHIGSMMYMGSGSIMDLSRRQKINGRSSTEDEIAG